MHIRFLSESSTPGDLTWLLWVALGFFSLIVFVGWLVSRTQDKEEIGSEGIDDLKKLEGIGPKVATILAEAGIDSYTDLVKAGAKNVDKLLDDAGLQMMDSAGWIKQARLAAKGDWDGLHKLQDELKGGR